MTTSTLRPTVAVVDHDAIAHNVAVMADVAGLSDLWAVVKADGYGHGAVEVARTALAHGAVGLAVATAEEGADLRAAGIEASVLVLAEPSPGEVSLVAAHALATMVASPAGVRAVEAAAAAAGTTVEVHVKVDIGMHRVGVDPDDAVALVELVRGSAGLRLAGIATHLPVADEADPGPTVTQLARFEELLDRLGPLDGVAVHVANSAATIAHPEARRDLVRVGIAVYGIAPSDHLDGVVDLRPAMSLRSAVSAVRRVRKGEGVSYGHRWRASVDTWVATVPAGYADGVVRALGSTGGEVLIGGRRRPIAGTVTMDQLMVDCGDEPPTVGDEVVLLGRMGDEVIRAEDWGHLLGTIGYEVVCGISARVPRRHVGGGRS